MKWLLRSYPKALVLVLVGLSIFREWQRGYFSRFIPFLKSQDWRPYFQMFTAFGIMAAALIWFDPFFLGFLQSQKTSWLGSAAEVGRHLGYGVNPWLLLAIGYAGTFALHRSRINRLFFRCMMSAGIAAALAHLLKILLLRARPLTNRGPLSFFNFFGYADEGGRFLSFPSGDVAVVAGIFCYLFYLTKNRALGLVATVLPVMTGLSRVMLNKHWPSDAVFAIGLGFIAGWFVYSYDEYLHQKKIAL